VGIFDSQFFNQTKMDTTEEIMRLSKERLSEAKILFDNGKFDGAYYLSGYSIELALKAKICERFCIPNLFTSDEKKLQAIVGINEVRKAVRTANNKSLSLGNSIFFQNWSEDIRYKPCGSIGKPECGELLELLAKENGILEWISAN
jgi:hypothetical protein